MKCSSIREEDDFSYCLRSMHSVVKEIGLVSPNIIAMKSLIQSHTVAAH